MQNNKPKGAKGAKKVINIVRTTIGYELYDVGGLIAAIRVGVGVTEDCNADLIAKIVAEIYHYGRSAGIYN